MSGTITGMAHYPERDEVTPQQLVAFLTKSRQAMTLRQIAGAMNLRHDGRRALTKIVSRMLHNGELDRGSRGRIQLPAPGGRAPKNPPARAAQSPAAQRKQPPSSEAGAIRGRLVAHRDGYGFVVPEKPVPALDGDL